MKDKFHYKVTVRDGQGNDHYLTGAVVGRLNEVCNLMLAESFRALAQGAVFGMPGQGACHGPYSIIRVEIEREP